MLEIKDGANGARVDGIRPPIMLAIRTAQAAFRHEGEDTIITSVTDGDHHAGSLHHTGAAVDLRTRHVTARQLERIVKKIREALTDSFDVVPESTHLHLEYDPR